MLSDERQSQIGRVLDHLAAFEPTRIAVEIPRGQGPQADTLSARYDRYRDGRFDLPASETYQLGFRLADRLGHERVYPVDFTQGLPFDSLMAYAGQNDPAFVGWFQGYVAAATEVLDRIQAQESIGANLRWMNTPEALALAQQMYARVTSVGAGDTYVGAHVASQWYDRNLRIFGNLAELAEPGERVLLIIGQGHAPVLRQLVRDHPGMVLAEPNAYLFP